MEAYKIAFADDLSIFKNYKHSTDNSKIMKELKECQANLHRWGRANQVCFETKKETMHVISKSDPLGENFKILACTFDVKLNMDDEIENLVKIVSWKFRLLLRSKKYYDTTDLIIEYKARVLAYMECRTAAIYHATKTRTNKVNHLQEHFIKELDVNANDAFLKHNLAPLENRRNIAMLGMIHNRAGAP